MAHLQESPSGSISCLSSRLPSILLKVLAVAWIFGGLACLGEVVEALGSEPPFELARRILIYLPIASLPVLIGFGLWKKKPWSRKGALFLSWLPLVLAILVLLWALIVDNPISLGLGMGLSLFGIPIIVFLILHTYFLLHPATRALFGGREPDDRLTEPSPKKKGRAFGFFRAASISLVAIIAVTGVVTLVLRSGPSYWIDSLGRHYLPNEIFGRSSRATAEKKLLKMGATRVVPAATRLLSSEVSHKRTGAADALTLFGAAGEPATGDLVLLIEEAKRFHFETPALLAADALAAIHGGSGTTPPQVQGLLASKNPQARALGYGIALRIDPSNTVLLGEAAKILQSYSSESGSQNDPSLVSTLLCGQLAESPDAAKHLIPELCQLLTVRPSVGSPDFLSIGALNALAQTAPEGTQALPVIIDAMGQRGQYVNGAAQEAFVAFGAESVRRISEVLAIPNEHTQKALYFALDELGGTAPTAVREALEHEDAVVRANAREILARRALDPLSYLPGPRAPPSPTAADFNNFLKKLEVIVTPDDESTQESSLLRFRGREYSPTTEAGGFVLFAVADDQVIISRSYHPWKSTKDRADFRHAFDWLPKNAFLVLTGYGFDQSARKGREGRSLPSYTDRLLVSSEPEKWGGHNRLDSLPPKSAYLLIGADSKVGIKAIERIATGEPAVYSGKAH